MQSRLIAAAALAAAFAAMAAAHAATNVYRWVDKAGKVHFSDTPPAPEDAQDVSQRRVGGGFEQQPNLPYATRMAMKANPVTLYTARGCADACEKARELLSNRGIPFGERNPAASAEDLEAFKKLSGGSAEVPLLVVGEAKLQGYDEASWNGALDNAGYPRTRLPGQPPTSGNAQPAPPADTSR
jgi:glutaredoxin